MDDMEAEAGAPQAAPADTGTELCIKVAADGTLSVYKESGEDEAAEQSAQPAADIGTALKMILDLYKGLAQPGAEQSFDDGFGGQQEMPGQGGTNSARRQGMMR